jgi:hypothetical protein
MFAGRPGAGQFRLIQTGEPVQINAIAWIRVQQARIIIDKCLIGRFFTQVTIPATMSALLRTGRICYFHKPCKRFLIPFFLP